MTFDDIAKITAIATGSTGLLVFLLYFSGKLIANHQANDAANAAAAVADKAELRGERDLARSERDGLRVELDGVRKEVVTALQDSNTGLGLNADGLARLVKVVDKNADGMDRMGKVVDKLVREARVVKLP